MMFGIGYGVGCLGSFYVLLFVCMVSQCFSFFGVVCLLHIVTVLSCALLFSSLYVSRFYFCVYLTPSLSDLHRRSSLVPFSFFLLFLVFDYFLVAYFVIFFSVVIGLLCLLSWCLVLFMLYSLDILIVIVFIRLLFCFVNCFYYHTTTT